MEFLKFSVSDHVATITIDRPAVRNALHPAACDLVEQNDEIWLAVLTGAGDQAFCAGRDLKRLAVSSYDENEKRHDDELLAKTQRLTDRFNFSKPIIARLNGSAFGGGLELALACDIIVAADHARLGLPEARRGLIATAGGVHRLPRQIPLKIAMGHLLTGRDMSARRAYELGLVNEVVPFEQLDSAVQSWADDLLRCAPLAVRATKQCILQGLNHPLAEAMQQDYEWELKRQQSEDALEGPRAFAEKREPDWQGR